MGDMPFEDVVVLRSGMRRPRQRPAALRGFGLWALAYDACNSDFPPW